MFASHPEASAGLKASLLRQRGFRGARHMSPLKTPPDEPLKSLSRIHFGAAKNVKKFNLQSSKSQMGIFINIFSNTTCQFN